MGKWFLDFSFWTRGYRTAQTAHCAVMCHCIIHMYNCIYICHLQGWLVEQPIKYFASLKIMVLYGSCVQLDALITLLSNWDI